MKMCPKGDDPLTLHQGYRTIQITTSVESGTLDGYFAFSFNDQEFSFPALSNLWSSEECKTAFQGLPNLKMVTCTQGTRLSGGATTYMVQFLNFPTMPYENNVFTNDGNPPLSKFKCSTAGVTSGSGVACTISDIAAYDLPGSFRFRFICSCLRCHLLYRILVLFKPGTV
jgi:hypothetical protein